MKQFLDKSKNKLRYLRGFFPKQLPIGMMELEKYTEELCSTYGLPHLASYRRAIATMIMHLGPTTHRKAPYYFAISIKKSMANQIAYELIQRIKDEEEEAKKAAQAQLESKPDESIQNKEV